MVSQLFYLPLVGREQKGFPLTFPKPFSSLPSPGSTESAKSPSSLLAFASRNMKLTILDSFIAAPRSEWQSRSSSSAEEDRSSSLEGSTASLPTQLIIRAAFSAIPAGNFKLKCTRAKVYNPKLSKRASSQTTFQSQVCSWFLIHNVPAGRYIPLHSSRLAAEGTTQSPM